MATLTISLSDDLIARANAQAVSAGCESLDEYFSNLILADLPVPLDPALEAELLAGLNSPGQVMTPADWDEHLQALIAKHKR